MRRQKMGEGAKEGGGGGGGEGLHRIWRLNSEKPVKIGAEKPANMALASTGCAVFRLHCSARPDPVPPGMGKLCTAHCAPLAVLRRSWCPAYVDV